MAAAYLLARTVSPATFCGKIPYPTRPEARRAMGKLSRGHDAIVAIGKGHLRAYRCGNCKGWHIGHDGRK